MSDHDDTPLARWSRRKQQARVEPDAAPPEVAGAPEPAPPPVPEPPEAETEAETLERLGLPDPDTLRMGDDFRPFMARAVPEAIRRRALRRLWVSNPVLANLDGLNDYDDDFRDSGLGGGVLRSAYRAGKGYLREITEDRSEGDAAPAAPAAAPAQPPEAAAVAPAVAEASPVSGGTNREDAARTADSEPQEAPRPRPRRMRFDSSGQV